MDYQNYSQPGDLFAEEEVVYASFLERLGAVFIDGLILIIPNLMLEFVFATLGSFLTIILGWLYFALQESGSAQATVGKRALNLKVTSVDGQRLSFGQASGRHFGKIISTLIFLFGYFMMLWDKKNQTLHDKMADAVVIKS